MLTLLRAGLIGLTLLAGLVGANVFGDEGLGVATGGWSEYGYWGSGYCPWSDYYPESAPYFAMHPPVYYSYVVPRPYGYSPFPYPPGVRTPEIAVPKPKVIQNRFVPRPANLPEAQNRVTQQPLRIRNPFVAQAVGSPVQQTAGLASPQGGGGAKVIYPARLAQPL